MNTVITSDSALVAAELAAGKIVAVPTETVYGLGANALDGNAVARIYEAKERPRFNPVIVHVKSFSEFEKYAEEIPQSVKTLADRFSPGPVTYILKKKNVIPDIVTAGNDSVGLRIPDHPVFQDLLAQCGFPLAAPSANMFGRISPTTAEEALKELGGRIEYILDGGRCSVGIESTVISFLNEPPEILRKGAVTREQIEETIGAIASDDKRDRLLSPGLLDSHYAPRKPLLIADDMPGDKILSELNACFLDLAKFGDLRNIAVNLFTEMRKLDEAGCGVIVCTKVENSGIGEAINDKLQRASCGKISFVNGSPVITNLKYA